jgi:tetratricopeptide (TPR) repeat protein
VRHHVTEDLSSLRQEMLAEAQALIPVLERLEAHAELAKAWRMIAFVHGSVCAWGAQVDAVQQAILHARAAGDRRLEARLSSAYTMGLCAGPTPAPDAITRTQEIVDRGLSDIQAEAIVRASLADLLAMRREFDGARREYLHAERLLHELGGGVVTTLATLAAARVELLAGRPEDAVRTLRPAYDGLGAIAERYFRPLVGAMLAEALFELGELDEAERTADDAADLADPDDIETQARLRAVRSRLAGAHGEAATAVEVAREGVEITREPDAPLMRADALATLAEALVGAGVTDEAEDALAEARALYEGKGDEASAARLTSARSKVA